MPGTRPLAIESRWPSNEAVDRSWRSGHEWIARNESEAQRGKSEAPSWLRGLPAEYASVTMKTEA